MSLKMSKTDAIYLKDCFDKLLEGKTLAHFEIIRVYKIINDNS